MSDGVIGGVGGGFPTKCVLLIATDCTDEPDSEAEDPESESDPDSDSELELKELELELEPLEELLDDNTLFLREDDITGVGAAFGGISSQLAPDFGIADVGAVLAGISFGIVDINFPIIKYV